MRKRRTMRIKQLAITLLLVATTACAFSSEASAAVRRPGRSGPGRGGGGGRQRHGQVQRRVQQPYAGGNVRPARNPHQPPNTRIARPNRSALARHDQPLTPQNLALHNHFLGTPNRRPGSSSGANSTGGGNSTNASDHVPLGLAAGGHPLTRHNLTVHNRTPEGRYAGYGNNIQHGSSNATATSSSSGHMPLGARFPDYRNRPPSQSSSSSSSGPSPQSTTSTSTTTSSTSSSSSSNNGN
jgi:hypothetical protein